MYITIGSEVIATQAGVMYITVGSEVIATQAGVDV